MMNYLHINNIHDCARKKKDFVLYETSFLHYVLQLSYIILFS